MWLATVQLQLHENKRPTLDSIYGPVYCESQCGSQCTSASSNDRFCESHRRLIWNVIWSQAGDHSRCRGYCRTMHWYNNVPSTKVLASQLHIGVVSNLGGNGGAYQLSDS